VGRFDRCRPRRGLCFEQLSGPPPTMTP
jgi:hypothetical protein